MGGDEKLSYRVGADIGGTFTDMVFMAGDGGAFIKKLSSTPEDFAEAIICGLGQFLAERGTDGSMIDEVSHGSTIATNAILEQKGALTGLLTTKGFRDVLEIRRVRMPKLYDLTWEKPPPLVERHLRLEVDERVGSRGEVLRPLDEESALRATRRLLKEGVESVAICFLHSYANPTHERRVKALIERLSPGLPVSISSEVLPEIKEYERTATTVVNAYVKPLVRGYLGSLREGLARAGVSAPLLIMQSNGGIMTARAAEEHPVHIIESGPAAGVIAAASMAQELGVRNLITLDMGGTTAKASIIENGELSRAAEYEVGSEISRGSRLIKGSGHLIRIPAVDIAEVGAGGGSIARLDRGGALHVGPESAGADPGPACYGRGGEVPTVTDANVLLGFLNPEYLLAGELPIKRDLSERAISERIARPLGMTPLEAAWGIHRIANASMNRAIRAVSVERGRDPRDFSLFAFGGNGPLHAAGIAEVMGIEEVIVPPAAGLLSSLGLLFSRVEHFYVRTYLRPVSKVAPDHLNNVMEEMEERALAELREEGYEGPQVALLRAVDLRYRKQIFELTLPLPEGELTRESLTALEQGFHEEHRRTYGYCSEGEDVEIVNLRMTGRGIPPKPRIPPALRLAGVVGGGGASAKGEREVFFGPDRGFLKTPVIMRAELSAPREGPLIVEEYDSTILVPPSFTAALDGMGNVRLKKKPLE
ncbi:MAG: hydantoinase/oxoprolinase family protein [Nitrospinota bacterium]